MKKANSENLNVLEGSGERLIIVVCDCPSEGVYNASKVMVQKHMDLFGRCAKECGFTQESFVFVGSSPPIPDECGGSEKRIGNFLAEYREEFLQVIDGYLDDADCIIALGKNSLRQLKGRSVKITTARGRFQTDSYFDDIPITPMISPAYVLRKPEMFDTFKADFMQVKALASHGWDMDAYQQASIDYKYEWCMDLDVLEEKDRRSIVVDTETNMLHWYRGLKILVIQISYKVGHTLLLPMDMDYWNDEKLIGDTSRSLPRHTKSSVTKLWSQVRELLENPETQVAGHNFKFDYHALLNHDVEVANWFHDSMQLSYVVNDNMQNRSLDECVRLEVPAMSGYADQFNSTVDKSKMRDVPHDTMLPYAGGDTDATLRLIKALLPKAKSDHMNYLNYLRVQMPSLRMFVGMERNGIEIDTDELYNLQLLLEEKADELLDKILVQASEVAPKVMLAHKEDGWRLSRDKFVTDLLFTKDGYGLKPRVFTPSTRKLPINERTPSASGNEHLPFFDHLPIVQDIQEYAKLTKMRTTYVGCKPCKLYTEIRALKSGKAWMAKWSHIMEKLEIEPFKQESEKLAHDNLPINLRRGYEFYDLDDGSQVAVGATRVFHVHETAPTGFWQYLDDKNKIHTTMRMDKTDTGRCLAGESIVATQSGGKRIDQVKVGDKVITHNCNFREVTDVFSNGVKMVYKVTTSDGRVIKATEKHKFLTEDGWTPLDEIAIGDSVYTDKESYQLQDFDNEEWRQLEGENYQVSNMGRVRSLGTKYNKPCILKPYSKGKWGHVRVRLGRKGRECGVHILIAEAFLGSRPDGMECLHLNGMAGDNRVANLKWGTSKENSEIAIAQGRTDRGDRCSYSKISREDVDSMKAMRESGKLYREIHEVYPHVSYDLIRYAIAGTRHLEKVNPYRLSNIVSIESTGLQATYDICVEEDHSFVANNFVVHNSASQSPNIQNLPKRGSIAKQYRKIFKAPDGWMFTSSDLSQAELRIAGWSSMDKAMLKIYAEGGDIHSATAGGVIGKTYEEFNAGREDETLLMDVANEWKGSGEYLRSLSSSGKKNATVADFCDFKRFQAKAINFGFLYGMWWTKFKDYAKTDFSLDLTDAEAKEAREKFFKTYPSLERYHKDIKKEVRRKGYVRALHGALRRLPSVASDDEKVQQMAERQAVNSPIQKFASDLALIGMFRFFRDCPEGLAYPALFIHDDCTVIHRVEDAEKIGKYLKFYMETQPFEWFGLVSPIPMVSDVSQGERLDRLDEKKGVEREAPEWYRWDLDEAWFL